jgi:hypothetical protein
LYAVYFLHFVFYAVWFLFQQICCNFIISNIREGKVVNAQNYVFYFESDIAKVFPFRSTCSSYDSEIKKKEKKKVRAKNDQQRKWTNVKLGLTAYMYGISSLLYVYYVYQKIYWFYVDIVIFSVHRYDIITGVNCDPHTIPTLSLTCCNVKYDVITLLTWLVARFVFIYGFIVNL